MPIIPDSRMASVRLPSEKVEIQAEIEPVIDIDSLSITDKYAYFSQTIIQSYNNEGIDIEKEWNYIVSKKEHNEKILYRLYNYGLLQDVNNICDCGIGLGECLFDIYQQSKEIENKKFYFFGVEKSDYLLDNFNSKLISFWDNNLTLIKGDIFEQDYSKYNIVYTYTPFKSKDNLLLLYDKIIEELPYGGVLIENFLNGLGIEKYLYEFLESDGRVEIIDLDGTMVYLKV